MKNYERKSLIKFFLTYFLTVAIFIIGLGYFYFQQQQTIILQKVAMSMHQYIVQLKQSKFEYTQASYDYKLIHSIPVKQQLPQKIDNSYIKTFPHKKGEQYIKVIVEASSIDSSLDEKAKITIIFQIIMLLVFMIISYILARISLCPMQDTISHMDRFIKDLIHDLNTPITSILLNTKMLQKQLGDDKKVIRINQSVNDISALYQSLDMILDEVHLEKYPLKVQKCIENIVQTYQALYPNMHFNIHCDTTTINSNEKAMKRILDNILSNACKYAKSDDPKIDIKFDGKILSIIDNGKGMHYPQKIFERSYKEDEKGHGIGMHIVHRLCMALDIDIAVDSVPNEGTSISLTF
ncbi:MAG: HAMP domain-containing sensor histidine kinase [Campylobacterota bacterium]|nr:HAMP domain-containing sensor histidine kinase [Campylobacterota bacterium]